MTLPDSWTNKAGSIPEYFEAIKQAQAPDRFSVKFLEGLGYKSTNDRKLIGILKSLGFLDADGKPTARYFAYLDLSRSEIVLAEGIRDAFADLFAVNKDAHKLTVEQVKNKLRTLYAGSKKDTVIGYIASTFCALVKCADFDNSPSAPADKPPISAPQDAVKPPLVESLHPERTLPKAHIASLQYHINVVLPESRDQAVYDAIFKALRDHLG